jgi:type IV secretory pathway VirB10-like protein
MKLTLEAKPLTDRFNFSAVKKQNGKLAGFRAVSMAASLMIVLGPLGPGALLPAVAASDSNLNFKIYSPQDPPAAKAEPAPAVNDGSDGSVMEGQLPAPAEGPKSIFEEDTPKLDTSLNKPAGALSPDAGPDSETSAAPAPVAPAAKTAAEAPAETTAEAAPATTAGDTPAATTAGETADASAAPAAGEAKADGKGEKVLQGYIRVVPTGTKIPIIMDTAVDSDTSQEADEFSARTSEDLTIDGSTVVPAGSIIKGRIAQLNAPKAMSRSGSVALKFDTITTPDNRQIPLVANIVAHGGVVHAKRGMKDIAIDAGSVAAPVLLGGLIGVLAGKSNTTTSNTSSSSSSKHVSKATGAAIGVGIGLAVGVIILCAKKGKKVEVRPGDELKIELAEDLRMPTI